MSINLILFIDKVIFVKINVNSMIEIFIKADVSSDYNFDSNFEDGSIDHKTGLSL